MHLRVNHHHQHYQTTRLELSYTFPGIGLSLLHPFKALQCFWSYVSNVFYYYVFGFYVSSSGSRSLFGNRYSRWGIMILQWRRLNLLLWYIIKNRGPNRAPCGIQYSYKCSASAFIQLCVWLLLTYSNAIERSIVTTYEYKQMRPYPTFILLRYRRPLSVKNT